MKAKFKVGDRVVVSDGLNHAMGYAGESSQFKGAHGLVVGVFEYQTLAADYDVVIDNHEAQNSSDCPGFEEADLSAEDDT